MSGDLGDGKHADPKLFEWWSEMIEYPIVSETGLTLQLVRRIANNCDFLAFREEDLYLRGSYLGKSCRSR